MSSVHGTGCAHYDELTELRRWQAFDTRIITKMALAEVCGLNSFVDFDNSREKNYFSQEIESYSKNFTNNALLAAPPYLDVSELYETIL